MTRKAKDGLAVLGLFLTMVMSLALGLVSAVVWPSQAHAATYKWANAYVRYVTYDDFSIRYCDGKEAMVGEGFNTTKDVCAFYWPFNTRADIWVEQTGTQLFLGSNCGSSKWQKFTSKTDTSRTARVNMYSGGCV